MLERGCHRVRGSQNQNDGILSFVSEVMCVHTISHNLFQGVDVEPGTWQGLAASPFFQMKPYRVWLLASGWVLRLWFPSNKGLGRAAELGKRKRGALRHFIQT